MSVNNIHVKAWKSSHHICGMFTTRWKGMISINWFIFNHADSFCLFYSFFSLLFIHLPNLEEDKTWSEFYPYAHRGLWFSYYTFNTLYCTLTHKNYEIINFKSQNLDLVRYISKELLSFLPVLNTLPTKLWKSKWNSVVKYTDFYFSLLFLWVLFFFADKIQRNSFRFACSLRFIPIWSMH